jgi:hypothetical protein
MWQRLAAAQYQTDVSGHATKHLSCRSDPETAVSGSLGLEVEQKWHNTSQRQGIRLLNVGLRGKWFKEIAHQVS